MLRYFLEVTYKGTNYSGFQIQENQVTIQSEVTKALQTLFRQPFALTGSSRTDAGVHALQNFFHFDTGLILVRNHMYNLNALLPADIAVKGIYQVKNEAHCRFDAIAREYKYLIYNQKDPFLADRGWLYPYPLDVNRLKAAARVLLEYQDFTSFSKRNTQVSNFICKLEIAEWGEHNGNLVYHVKANRFLRGMVRGMVGTMLKVGRGLTSEEELRKIIEAKDCTKADFTTPPQGLLLVAVHYKEVLIGV